MRLGKGKTGLYAGVVLSVQGSGPGSGDSEKAETWSVSKIQNSPPVQGHRTRMVSPFQECRGS